MPAVRTLGLVLRSIEVFETSKVLTLFTRDEGKVSALAKGARRLKSSFQSSLDLLSICDIVFLRKAASGSESETLDLLTEASLDERFDALRQDLPALYAGYYVAELLSEMTDFHDPHPRLFDAARVTLRHLSDPNLRPHRVIRFELACLREAGHAPALDACVSCGKAVLPPGSKSGSSQWDVVAFGLTLGGVLCPSCRHGQTHVAALSARTLESLRLLALPGDGWRTLDLRPDRGLFGPIRGTIGSVICHLIGRRPRLLPYLGV